MKTFSLEEGIIYRLNIFKIHQRDKRRVLRNQLKDNLVHFLEIAKVVVKLMEILQLSQARSIWAKAETRTVDQREVVDLQVSLVTRPALTIIQIQ